MRVIIDRFEGDVAVVELGENMLNVPRALFPEAQEGDTVEISVLGKVHDENEETPHDIFERLRKKRRNKRTGIFESDAADQTETAQAHSETSAADDGTDC